MDKENVERLIGMKKDMRRVKYRDYDEFGARMIWGNSRKPISTVNSRYTKVVNMVSAPDFGPELLNHSHNSYGADFGGVEFDKYSWIGLGLFFGGFLLFLLIYWLYHWTTDVALPWVKGHWLWLIVIPVGLFLLSRIHIAKEGDNKGVTITVRM